MIAAFANHIQTDLVVRPEIKTPADLRGDDVDRNAMKKIRIDHI
jgi:hypothetical protein